MQRHQIAFFKSKNSCDASSCMSLTVELSSMHVVCDCEVCVVLTRQQSMRSCVDSPALLPSPCSWRRPRAGSEGHCKPSTPTSTPISRQLSHTLPHTAVSATHARKHQLANTQHGEK